MLLEMHIILTYYLFLRHNKSTSTIQCHSLSDTIVDFRESVLGHLNVSPDFPAQHF